MTSEKFTLQQYSIGAILGLIEANDFVIPEIQRPFVWKKTQVRDLIDSLYNGLLFGKILMYKQKMELKLMEKKFLLMVSKELLH